MSIIIFSESGYIVEESICTTNIHRATSGVAIYITRERSYQTVAIKSDFIASEFSNSMKETGGVMDISSDQLHKGYAVFIRGSTFFNNTAKGSRGVVIVVNLN